MHGPSSINIGIELSGADVELLITEFSSECQVQRIPSAIIEFSREIDIGRILKEGQLPSIEGCLDIIARCKRGIPRILYRVLDVVASHRIADVYIPCPGPDGKAGK